MNEVCLNTALLVWKLNNQYAGRMCLSFSITVKKRYRVTFSFGIVQALEISFSFRDHYFDVQFSPNMFLRDESRHSELRPCILTDE